MFFGLKFFYVNTPRRYDWPLFTKKKSASRASSGCLTCRSDADCRRLIASLQVPLYRACFTVIYAYGLHISEAVTLPITAVDSRPDGSACHRQAE